MSTSRTRTRRREAWRRMLAVVAGFRGDNLAARAGNLTFITMGSLVPLAAAVLSLVHVIDRVRLQSFVMQLFDQLLSPGGKAQTQATLHTFAEAAKSRAGGGLSFLFLLVSAGALMRNLDASLNELWQVRRQRPLFLALLTYLGLLLVSPLFLLAGLIGTQGLKRLAHWAHIPIGAGLVTLTSMSMAIALFTVLYRFAPKAPVRLRSAFFGALAAGVTWEIARHGYQKVASFIFGANPVFGTLGLAPLFLMWLFVSWFLLLAGARLAYAYEHADYHHGFRNLRDHPRARELIGARIARVLAERHRGEGPTLRELAMTVGLPAQRVNDVVDLLDEAGLIFLEKGRVYCAQEPSMLTLFDVSKAVGGQAHLSAAQLDGPVAHLAKEASLFSPLDELSVRKLSGISWETLAHEASGEAQKP